LPKKTPTKPAPMPRNLSTWQEKNANLLHTLARLQPYRNRTPKLPKTPVPPLE